MENTNNHKSLDFTFTNIEKYGHEQVLYCSHKTTNFKAIIAIHSTVLGPALGGVRILNYANEGDALIDVLKLSRGMTYKNSLAGLDLGGGKAVILGEPQTVKNDVNFKQAFISGTNRNFCTSKKISKL